MTGHERQDRTDPPGKVVRMASRMLMWHHIQLGSKTTCMPEAEFTQLCFSNECQFTICFLLTKSSVD